MENEKKKEKLGEAVCQISSTNDKYCSICGTKMHLEIERCINGKRLWRCPECDNTTPYKEEKTEKTSDITCSLCGSKMKFEGRAHKHLMFSCSNENCQGAFLIRIL